MARYYVGMLAIGNPKDLLERIRQAVQRLKLTRTIPVVKVEKKPRGQFYVFLAVEGTDGNHLPDTIKNVLQLARLTGQHYWPLDIEDIKPMVNQKAEVETYRLNSLTYKSLWNNDAGDAFDFSDSPSVEEDRQTSERGERYDKLLYWLSATGEGSWQTFAQACRALQLVDQTPRARYILRKLILLGHIECSPDGSRWAICPPALVKSAINPDCHFLAGQRTPKLLKQLSVDNKIPNPPNYQGPTRIEVANESSAETIRLEKVGVASHRLAERLPELDGWKQTLEPIDRLVTAQYEFGKWNGWGYAPCETVYQKEGRYVAESGLYRLKRKADSSQGSTPYQINLFFDQESQRWLRGDWYGLRFLADHAARVDLEVVYDATTGTVMIPLAEHWPLLYERALVLATGFLPTSTEDAKWLRYDSISTELCQILTNKLSVSIRRL